MIDKESVEAIQQAQATCAAQESISAALGGVRQDIVALPSNFETHDLEDDKPTRRRARGVMKTRFIAPFAKYSEDHAEPGAAIFINPDNLNAEAVLNLGNPDNPGHADNVAVLKLEPTAAYASLMCITARDRTQAEIAEFMEDWSDCIKCFAGSDAIKTPHAIAAIRNITIDATRKVETSEQQLRASQSAFEQIQASSRDGLPTYIYFTCQPYSDLESRPFVMRLSVMTGEAKPKLMLRIQKAGEHMEQMAEEMAGKLREAFGKTKLPVLVGTYAKKP